MARITSTSILLTASILFVPVAGALAQDSTNNPNHEAGVEGSKVANPQRPSGTANPALTTQTLPKAAEASVPTDKNPERGRGNGSYGCARQQEHSIWRQTTDNRHENRWSYQVIGVCFEASWAPFVL